MCWLPVTSGAARVRWPARSSFPSWDATSRPSTSRPTATARRCRPPATTCRAPTPPSAAAGPDTRTTDCGPHTKVCGPQPFLEQLSPSARRSGCAPTVLDILADRARLGPTGHGWPHPVSAYVEPESDVGSTELTFTSAQVSDI